MAKLKKNQKRLNSRIKGWEEVAGARSEKFIKTIGNSTYHKPGSNKK